MTSLDEELLRDSEEDEREAQYIISQLPEQLAERYSKDDVLYMMEAIVEYYFTSGVLESNDEYVDIDLQAVADYVCSKAVEDGREALNPDEVLLVVQSDMDYQEEHL